MQNKNIAIKRMWVRIEIKINKLEGNINFLFEGWIEKKNNFNKRITKLKELGPN